MPKCRLQKNENLVIGYLKVSVHSNGILELYQCLNVKIKQKENAYVAIPASWIGVLASALAEPWTSDTRSDRSDRSPIDRLMASLSLRPLRPDPVSPIPSTWCPCGDLDAL